MRAARAHGVVGTALAAAAVVVVVVVSAPRVARAEALTQDEAVAIALSRNRAAIAARLDIEGAELDVVAARIYPNPTLSYNLGNLVLGKGNDQGMGQRPGFLDQPVQTVGVTQVLDLWSKRGARAGAAEQGVARQRLVTEDALREIAYAVRSAFADLSREQSERDLAREVAARYADTVRISEARYRAGDISEAELRKIELEGIRYDNAVIDAEMEWDVSRQKLAALMGLPGAGGLPERVQAVEARPTFDAARLVADALERRPDLRAAGAARKVADAEITAARREAYPDFEVGAAYTRDSFTVSGDNPNTLGLSVSLPLPLFDRNQAGLGRARLELRRADNDGARLRLEVEHDVAEAVRRAGRAQALLKIYEGAAGGGAGMLTRAADALRVAEKSYKAGAASLLDLLEAERTNLETRADYLRVLYDFRQAAIDVTHAVGEGTP
jgi:cobalt-zinc-cadmium efflux system outer membrane protein